MPFPIIGEWPEYRIERLKVLWDEGKLSAAGISAELGVSRNAVLGKVHRLGLASKAPVAQDRKLADAKRLGFMPRKPPVKLPRQPTSLVIAHSHGQIGILRPAESEFKAPIVPPGTSKTSPTYRNRLGFLPEMSVNRRRDMLAEAMRNTAALPIPAEAS